MEDKHSRLSAIKKIIKLNKIGSQDQLLLHLEKHGIQVTQATLSRDLKQLNVAKMADGLGGYYYTLLEGESGSIAGSSFVQDFERGFLSLEFSRNFGVIRTLPGHASSIAFAIDNMKMFEILATIAGDDTILLIPRDGITRKEIIEILKKKIPALKEGLE